MSLLPSVKTDLVAGAIVAAGGAAIAWLAQPVSTARAVVAVAAVAAMGLAHLWLRSRDQRQQDEVQRFLVLLGEIDELDLLKGGAGHLPLDEKSRWSDVCRRLAGRLERAAELTHGAEQGKAEAELRVHKLDCQRRRATDVLEALPAPVVAVNQYDEVVLANPAACDLFAAAEDPRGKPLADFAPTAALTELVASARRRGAAAPRTSDVTWTGEDGVERAFRANCRCLQRQGSDCGAVAVLEDISDRLALQRRNAEFVSAASHEIKAPLAGIKAYVELLADGDLEDGESTDEVVEVIDRQADRLQRLIDNLLNLARIEAGVERVQKSSRSLNELLEDGLRVVQPAAERKRIQLVNDLSPMYLGVLADRDMLCQAAINLLSNAVKYTPDGGAVTLRSRMEDTRLSFEVEDTGIGLSEEDCRRVFEKFYRAQNGDMAPGTGLGLTLAKHIVEDVHGGALSVTSVPGEGTVFRVTLPRHVHARRELD